MVSSAPLASFLHSMFHCNKVRTNDACLFYKRLVPSQKSNTQGSVHVEEEVADTNAETCTREPKYEVTIELFTYISLEFLQINSRLVSSGCVQKYLHCKYFHNHVAHLYSQQLCGSICSYIIRNIPRVLRGSKNSYLVLFLLALCYYCTFSLLHLVH